MVSSSQSSGTQAEANNPTRQKSQGVLGEAQALAFLQHNGLRLIERNFRCRTGEIDLVMLEHETIVFVEVRKRRSMVYGGAAASVTVSKQAKLVSAAQVFLQRYATPPGCRFDVIAIDAEKIDWLKNAIEV